MCAYDSRSPGRVRNKPLKPLRGECRVISGVTVVTNACAFYHCTRGCGRIGRPAFPAPSDLQGARRKWQHSGASGREIAKPWLHTAGCLKIESVATHSVRTHAPLCVVPAKAGT